MGDLVHVPFYEVQATIGGGRLAISVEACSGRVYPERMPPSAGSSTARHAGVLATAVIAFVIMFLEATFISSAWLAALGVALTAWALYRLLIGSMGRTTA